MSRAVRGKQLRGRREKRGGSSRRERFEASGDMASSTIGQDLEEEALEKLSLKGKLWESFVNFAQVEVN